VGPPLGPQGRLGFSLKGTWIEGGSQVNVKSGVAAFILPLAMAASPPNLSGS